MADLDAKLDEVLFELWGPKKEKGAAVGLGSSHMLQWTCDDCGRINKGKHKRCQTYSGMRRCKGRAPKV